MMYDYWGQGSGSGNDAGSFLFMILMMAILITVIIVAVRYLGRDIGRSQKGVAALDVLEKRYAQGEIDKKEFEEKRKTLRE